MCVCVCVSQNYLSWMKQGIHIITPNKKLGSGPLEQYQAVKKLGRESYIHFFYEVRVIRTPHTHMRVPDTLVESYA